MRVVSVNLNGIRSAAKKGIGGWLRSVGADVVCCQEVRARDGDIPDDMRDIDIVRNINTIRDIDSVRDINTGRGVDKLRGVFSLAQKAGYAGTGLHLRRKPLRVITTFGHPVIDTEGRYVCAEFGNCRIVSFYMPSGSSGDIRLRVKMQVMKALYQRMQQWMRQAAAGGMQTLLCGDINIAHTCKDLHNWKSNQKNSGFLPVEREWMDAVVKLGMVDVFRKLNHHGGEYTWWSNRGRAWEKNVGWRLDYQLATPLLAARARDAFVYRDVRFSDHAPVVVRYHFALR